MTKALQHIQHLRPKVDFIINGGDSIMDALAATKESTQTQWVFDKNEANGDLMIKRNLMHVDFLR